MIQDNQTPSALILGAGGRLGTMLRRIWARQPPAGIDLHFQSRTPMSDQNCHQWAPGDAPHALPACTTVVALWGRTAGDETALALNTTLADETRRVARASGASRALHLSSAAIYGPAADATEATTPAPAAAYGRAKLEMEVRVAGFDDPGLHHLCLRLANVVGADSLAPALRARDPVPLDRFADGKGPLRSYIGAQDLADIVIALTRLPVADLPAMLNIAAHRPLAMQDLAHAAGKEITWRAAPSTAIQNVTMDTTRLARLLPDQSPVSDPTELIREWHHHSDPS